MCNQDQQSCEGEEFVITMAIGQKTRSGESFCRGDYHVNGPNTLLRMISFLYGDYHDYHGNWTENWERGRFLPWWLPWQWAKHGFEVDEFLPWWLPWQWDMKKSGGKVFAMVINMSMGKTRFWGFCHGNNMSNGPMPTKIRQLAGPLKKKFKKSMFEIRFQEFQKFQKILMVCLQLSLGMSNTLDR